MTSRFKHGNLVQFGDNTNGFRYPYTKTPDVVVTPVVSANAAYTANDAVGGLITLANVVDNAGWGGKIAKIAVLDKDSQGVALNLALYNASVTPTTDNAAFAPSAPDLLKCIGVILIATGDYVAVGANGKMATKLTTFPYYIAVGTSLYGQLYTTGTPTYTTTSALVVTVSLIQD